MSNSASKNMCKTKRQIGQLRKELETNFQGNKAGYNSADMKENELMKKIHEFWQGPMRHGNNRKYEAALKVDARKSDRMKQREEDRKTIQNL